MEIGRFLEEASHKPYRHSRNALSVQIFEPFGVLKAWFSDFENGISPRPEIANFPSQKEMELTPILEALESAP